MKGWHARLRVGGVSVVFIIMSGSIDRVCKYCDTTCASLISSSLSMMSSFTSLTCLECTLNIYSKMNMIKEVNNLLQIIFLLHLVFLQIKVVSYSY